MTNDQGKRFTTNHVDYDKISLEAKIHEESRQLPKKLSVTCSAITNKNPTYFLFTGSILDLML